MLLWNMQRKEQRVQPSGLLLEGNKVTTVKKYLRILSGIPTYMHFHSIEVTCALFLSSKNSHLVFNCYLCWLFILTASILMVDTRICPYRKVPGEYLNSLLMNKLTRCSVMILYLSCAGRGNLQFLSRWSVDRGYLDTWHSSWSVYMGWSIRWPQRKAKCLGNWSGRSPGTILCTLRSSIFFHSCCFCFFQKYVEMAASLEGLSPNVPLYKISEGNEPCFFTTYFSWDYTKAVVSTQTLITRLLLNPVNLANFNKFYAVVRSGKKKTIFWILYCWPWNFDKMITSIHF